MKLYLAACVAMLCASAAVYAQTDRSPCPDPLSVVNSFYDANDAGRFDEALAMLSDDVTLASWAEGVNGHHMRETHLSGKEQIRTVLGGPGLRRTQTAPDRPVYRETRVKATEGRVELMLEPDRLRPNGKPFNPFRVEIVLDGCLIKALTVIDSITWL